MPHHPSTTPLQVMAILAAALAVVIVVAGCSLISSPPSRLSPSPSPTIPTTNPTRTLSPSPSGPMPPTVTAPLGPPPADCPIAGPPQTMTSSDFGGGFVGTVRFAGASPAWELGIETTGVVAVAGIPYPSTKLMWVVGPGYDLPVTLSGHDLRSGVPLWFDVYPPNATGTDEFGTSAVLDPTQPNRGRTTNRTGRWNIWGIGLIVDAASCFDLEVTAEAGSWHTVFAAGTTS